jgi:hypothetical protein
MSDQKPELSWSNNLLKGLEAISYLAAVVALFLLWQQMSSDAAAKRSENALSYVAQYSTGEISKSRQNLARAWLPYTADIAAINSAQGLPEDQIKRLVTRIVAEYDEKNPTEPATLSIEAITSFYDQVQTCIDVNACDEKVLDASLRQNARDFQQTYAVIIENTRRTMSAQFGAGLQKFILRNGHS